MTLSVDYFVAGFFSSTRITSAFATLPARQIPPAARLTGLLAIVWSRLAGAE
jgi:hypothetical protein